MNDKLTSNEQDFTLANQIADAAVQRVCELPDYTSPDDQPDLLQCKPWELHACVVNAIEQIAPHLTQPPALETCEHEWSAIRRVHTCLKGCGATMSATTGEVTAPKAGE